MKNKKMLNSLLSAAVASSVLSPAIVTQAADEAFGDIEKSWAKGSIEYLLEHGIIDGYGDGEFKPTEKMDRETFSALLGKTLGVEGDAEAGETFKDVSDWAKGHVGALHKMGIVSGYDSDTYGAKDVVTREQMAVFFVRALGYETQAYALNLDVDFDDKDAISDWAKPAVAFASKMGFIQGDGVNFNPKEGADRQSVAALSERLHKDGDSVYKPKAEEILVEENYDSSNDNTNDDVSSETLTITSGSIHPDNNRAFEVEGEATPGEIVQITVTYGDDAEGTFGMVSLSAGVDSDGFYSKDFNLEQAPVGEATIYVSYWSASGDETESLEKTVSVLDEVPSDGSNEEPDNDNGDTEEPVELAVGSIIEKDVNTIEVTFNEAVSSNDNLSFFFDSEEVTSVSYEDSKAVVTVPAMSDDAVYPFVVKDENGEDLSITQVKFNTSEITSIETAPIGHAYQVGERAKITWTVKDDDGDVVAGTPVRVRVVSGSNIKKEEIINTDSNGKVELDYTSFDVREDSVSAIALDRPTVRDVGNVIVDWSVAVTGQISVDAMTDVELGSQDKSAATLRDYNVKFLDENGDPLPQGTEVYVYLGDNADYGVKTSVVVPNGLDGTDLDETGDITPHAGYLTTKHVSFKIGTFDGTAKVQVGHNEVGETIYPMFYYHKDKFADGYTIKEEDPRVQAGSITAVEQVPSIEINDTTDKTLPLNGERKLTVTALDQFGNTYLGDVSIGLKEALDNLNATNNGKVRFEYDLDRDGVIDTTDQEDKNTVRFQKSSMDIVIKGLGGADVNDGDEATFVSFIENPDKPGLENALVKDEVKTSFLDRDILDTINLSNKGGTTISEDGHTDFHITFTDVDGNSISLNDVTKTLPKLNAQVLNEEGKVVENIELGKDNLSLSTEAEAYLDDDPNTLFSFDDATLFADGDNDLYDDTIVHDPAGEKEYILRFNAETPGVYDVRVFADETQDLSGNAVSSDNINTLQDDEIFATAQITVEGPEIDSGDMKTNKNVYVLNDASAADTTDEITFDYQIKDQYGFAYKPENAQTIAYTIKNTGDAAVKVSDFISGVQEATDIDGVVQPGDTRTFEATMNTSYDGAYKVKVQPTEDKNAVVEINAQVKDNDATKATMTGNWFSVKIDATSIAAQADGDQYKGTIVAFDKGANWYLLNTSVGNVKIAYTTSDPNHKYVVNESTDADGSAFVEHIAIGAEVTATFTDLTDPADGTPDQLKHNLNSN